MRGFVRQRSQGSWQLGWKEQDPVTGAWKQKTTTVRGTRKQAEAKLTETLNSINTGTYVEPNRLTVREFLERWLRDYVEVKIEKPKTRVTYRTIVNDHLIPALGAVPLMKLTPLKVQEYCREKLASGRVDAKGKPTGKPLSSTTVHGHHQTLHKALDCAVKWGLVARNVCDAVEPPKKLRAELQTWTPAEAVRFLETARETKSRYYPLFATAIYTGTRLGELLGARWADVDLDAGTLVVQQTLEKSGRTPRFGTPKTKKSRRLIPLPPELVSILRHWKAEQNEERLLLGPGYRDLGLVFTIPGGGAVSADNLRKRDFARLVKQAKVPAVRIHDLRHCYASTLLAAGVPLKTVSELMGHSTINITADVYGHLTMESKREAVNVLSRALAGAGAS